MKYKAFISYKHGDDDALAASLEKSLEKFAKPTFKRRAIEIFRDGNDLSAAADLGEKIRTGLQESEYFICMASPKYAASKWCSREAEFWRDQKAIDNFLIVLTDGEIIWDESTNDFDWNKTTSLPKSLSGAFKGEPFYIDFRDLSAPEKFNLDNPEFKSRLVLLAATLHGKSVGDMVGEAVKQHKRTMRIRNAAITMLSILLVAAVTSAIYAVGQKNRALLSNYIANSQAQFNEDPTKSLRLAEHAYTFALDKGLASNDAAEQLIKVFYSGYGFYQTSLNIPMDFSDSNVLTYENTAAFSTIKSITDSIYATIPDDEYLQEHDALYFNENTNEAIYAVTSQGLDFPRIYFINEDPYEGRTIEMVEVKLEGFSGYTAYIQDIAITADGAYTFLGSANGKAALLDNNIYKNDAKTNVFKDRAILRSSTDFPVRYVAFNDNDTHMATAAYGSTFENGIREDSDEYIYYYQKVPFPYIELRNNDSSNGNGSLDGNYYMVNKEPDQDPFTWFHFAHEIRDAQENILVEFPNAKGASLEFVYSPDNKFSMNYQGVFNEAGDLLIRFDLDRIDTPGIAYCFSEDSKYIKISYLDGLQRIFALDAETIITRINNTSIMGTIAPLSADDKALFLVQ